MASFIYNWVRFWVLDGCPVCQKLLSYEDGDKNLKSIFQSDCKVKRILKRRGFNLEQPYYGEGKVWFDLLKRGSELRRDLALRRSKPDYYVDLETRRLIKTVKDYGVDYIRHAIFIERFEAINIGHPANQPLAYRYQIRVVPTVMSPFAPHGILRGLSAKEDELEIERLLFTGGSKIRPAQDVTSSAMFLG